MGLLKMPNEVLFLSAIKLGIVDVGALCQVNRFFHNLITPILYREYSDVCLQRAARHGFKGRQKDFIRVLLEKKALDSIEACPLLVLALDSGQEEVALMLLDLYTNTQAQDHQGYTPLMAAAKYGNLEVFGRLIQKDDMRLTAEDNNGWTALTLAARGGHTKVVHEILAMLKNTNEMDGNNRTALLVAAASGQIHTVQALVARSDVDFDQHDVYGCSALCYAEENGRDQIIAMLLEIRRFEPSTDDLNCALLCSTSQGHASVVKRLIELDFEGMNAGTSLVKAACLGHPSVIAVLLPNLTTELDEYGPHALCWAVSKGDMAVVELLLANQSNGSNTPVNGQTLISVVVFEETGTATFFLASDRSPSAIQSAVKERPDNPISQTYQNFVQQVLEVFLQYGTIRLTLTSRTKMVG